MTEKHSSPYLTDGNRLGDVIAAIQVMAVYKSYKLPFDQWAYRITADKRQADRWKIVFLEHPEFFRLDSERERASLVWRRQFPRRYDVDEERVLTPNEYAALPQQRKAERVSRIPLSSSDIKALIDTAVNLHSRALEEQKDRRWWVALAGAAGGLVGSIVGGLLKPH
ncbi:hypothetical protein [Caballeronia sp. EK]|uniref:hypothetical protein n=1 Tax=Caballeronia sp. EK TaxID=2767469 RepID=UPI001CA461EE|nr:hypothetical protein [Caballeronia sp. EK]